MQEKKIPWDRLNSKLTHPIQLDSMTKILYSTDASIYRAMPTGVVYPAHERDLIEIIHFASKHKVSLIPRGAGTSLAGQVVGNGLVLDFKHMNKIIELNTSEGYVVVQPGVIRDELNFYLEDSGYFFSPITSTANRATIGGMVGNNSSGTNSIKYGTTRDKVMSVRAVLSDGTITTFEDYAETEFEQQCQSREIQGELYRYLNKKLTDPSVAAEINQQYPHKEVHRRNTGYALDELLKSDPFNGSGTSFNFSKLLAGSEGTLCLFSEIKLKLDPFPPSRGVLAAIHFESIPECFKATSTAMRYSPFSCEMMDKKILDCTKENIQQRANRYFIEGDPAAILMVEFRNNNVDSCLKKINDLTQELSQKQLGYHTSLLWDEAIKDAWNLRASGLGVLSNIPGPKKAVACIEDTAVPVENLVDYMADFATLMANFNQDAIYYAHAGAGEIHLRPLLDLRDKRDRKDFIDISTQVMRLVKKYRGSVSGEHGDGRVRGYFVPEFYGPEIYQIFLEIKHILDPVKILNPGKIVEALPIDKDLRADLVITEEDNLQTKYDFSEVGGIIAMAEKCNGSGDCRKLPLSGGTMCPSYQATLSEKDTTRGRANILRESLYDKSAKWDNEELTEVMDLCLACKACTSECPSNVNLTMLKSEVLYQKGKKSGFSLKDKAYAHMAGLYGFASLAPAISNAAIKSKWSGKWIRKILDIHPQRSLPLVMQWKKKKLRERIVDVSRHEKGAVVLFIDEFSKFLEPHLVDQSKALLEALGFNVKIINHPESGRAAMSRGLLDHAAKIADQQIALFGELINEGCPLIGIEPSAILSFRDEYLHLCSSHMKDLGRRLAKNVFLMEEFLHREIENENVSQNIFGNKPDKVAYHGHCHQKSLSDAKIAPAVLSFPEGVSVHNLKTGCCGMAGSFGYEKNKYQLSMDIAELQLFPQIRELSDDVTIIASGTSCRHQIWDGLGRKAIHPVEFLQSRIN